jgi:hypothetical protein
MADPVNRGTKAGASVVQHIVKAQLTDYLVSIGKTYPDKHELAMNLADDLCLPPNSPELDAICADLSDDFYCDKPSAERLAEWRDFLDLYLYYLCRARMRPSD